ncbi:GGDEF domain-containing protein [Undibacter mobilis]|uniref:diguanylate cyclase n=1 Tax=Undibacter mobilis TaxID=2292256 RepID=A0A371BEA5_9BRAD|nr:GGDEF domain-containing protein [Undibacter mobilis]
MTNVVLLAADALIYFVALAGLLRLRDRIGLGPFFCALGVLHFLETYLASIFYITLPLGIVTSPGSTVLFTGKLMLLLLLYIREDAAVVRQPIYGLLFGNVLVFVLGFVLRHHTLAPLTAGRAADFAFLDEMGGLMVWGTAILFIDCIIIILLYERTRAWFGDRVFPRLLVSSTMVLTFDQVAFFSGLSLLTGAGVPVLIGGWIAKMGAVALYSVFGTVYLLYFERPQARESAPRLRDVFDTLTYRERYESLLARTGCDPLTGTLDRHALETYGRRAVDGAAGTQRPLSLLLIDLDHLNSVNERFGRSAGDRLLKLTAREIMSAARVFDFTYRFGGEEFVVIADGLAGDDGLALAERIRHAVAMATGADPAGQMTVSVGVASTFGDGDSYDALFMTAAGRLAQAKALGRNQVVGPQR